MYRGLAFGVLYRIRGDRPLPVACDRICIVPHRIMYWRLDETLGKGQCIGILNSKVSNNNATSRCRYIYYLLASTRTKIVCGVWWTRGYHHYL